MQRDAGTVVIPPNVAACQTKLIKEAGYAQCMAGAAGDAAKECKCAKKAKAAFCSTECCVMRMAIEMKEVKGGEKCQLGCSSKCANGTAPRCFVTVEEVRRASQPPLLTHITCSRAKVL